MGKNKKIMMLKVMELDVDCCNVNKRLYPTLGQPGRDILQSFRIINHGFSLLLDIFSASCSFPSKRSTIYWRKENKRKGVVLENYKA